MKLNNNDITEFDEQGYLFIPALLTPEETEVLQRDIPGYAEPAGTGGYSGT